MTEKQSQKIRIMRWEEQNVSHGRGYYDRNPGTHKTLRSNMASRGYEAYRVSPQTTTKNGLKYRAVYGASVEPTYGSGGTRTNFPKVRWFKQGYIRADRKDKPGTKTTMETTRELAKNVGVDHDTLRRQLMIKEKSSRSRSSSRSSGYKRKSSRSRSSSRR